MPHNPLRIAPFNTTHEYTADLTKYEDYYSTSVFDGQTKELLVNVTSKKGQKTSYIKDGNNDYGQALEKSGLVLFESDL